jgi:hypothetical protein
VFGRTAQDAAAVLRGAGGGAEIIGLG